MRRLILLNTILSKLTKKQTKKKINNIFNTINKYKYINSTTKLQSTSSNL